MTAISQDSGLSGRLLVACAAVGGIWLLYQAFLTAVGAYAWDDGVITLAYARTWAETGHFALTPVSEQAEGSSSLLFVGLFAALQWVHPLSMDALIRASQELSLLAWLATLLTLSRCLQPHVPEPGWRWLVLGSMALLPMPMAEVFNGMEMSSFALLLLWTVIAFERRHPALWLLIPLTLLARFEAVFYLGFAWAALGLWRPQRRHQAWQAALAVAGVWLLLAVWRWQVFGDVLPNTIHAKVHAPYTPAGHGLALFKLKAMGLAEFLQVNAAWLVALAWLIRRAVAQGRLRVQGLASLDFKAWLVLAFAVFGLLTGVNWGYQGRMCLAALPLLVWWVAERWTASQARWPTAWGLLALVWLTMILNVSVGMGNAKTLLRGAYFQGLRLPAVLHQRVEGHVQGGGSEYAHWMGVSPANYRATGRLADRLRVSMGWREVSLLTPDVGGLSLCCPQIRVLDLGLLTSPVLAREGYAALGAYLDTQRPALVITHSFWSETSGIYGMAAFTQHYVPVVLDDTFMWLRREHLPRLLASPAWRAHELDGPAQLRRAKYGGMPEDMPYLQTLRGQPLWQFEPRGGLAGALAAGLTGD
jgi:hypothetical protein